jgi:HEAT repeat protein
MQQLKSTKAEQREEAASELRDSWSSIQLLRIQEAERLVGRFAEALSDSSPLVRRDAAYTLWLVGLGGDQVVAALKQAIKAADDQARFATYLAFWKFTEDESSYSRALEALKHENASLRLEAARALGAYAHSVRGTSAHNEKTVLALIPALRDNDDKVRDAARASLLVVCGIFGGEAKKAVPALVETLEAKDRALRYWAAGALGGVGPEAKGAIPSLLQALGDQDETVRHKSAWALGKIGSDAPRVVPALAAALSDKSVAVRFESAFALGTIGAEAKPAVSALQAATRDGQARVRVVARLALWRTTGEEGFVRPAVAEASATNQAVLLDAFVFFSSIGAPALPVLLDSLQHREASVRMMAAYALSEIRSSATKAIPALIQAVRDPDHEVRNMAAFALGALGARAEGAAPALARALQDADPEVRDSAAWALRSIDPEVVKNRMR